MQSICQRERYIVVPDQISGEFRNPHLPHHNVACLIRHAAQPHLLVWTSGFGSVHVLRRRESQLPPTSNTFSYERHQFHRWPYKDRGNHEDFGGMRIVTTFRVSVILARREVCSAHGVRHFWRPCRAIPFAISLVLRNVKCLEVFSTSAKRCRPARGKYLNAHPR